MDVHSVSTETLTGLARAHGTPIYVYDLRTVVDRVAAFEGFDVVRYAIKANSNLAVLATLRAAGVRCEAVSAGEVRRALKKGGPCGRRLDFLMQELNREANTLSSKSQSATTTLDAVELKVLIEQMREQIQNIE